MSRQLMVGLKIFIDVEGPFARCRQTWYPRLLFQVALERGEQKVRFFSGGFFQPSVNDWFEIWGSKPRSARFI